MKLDITPSGQACGAAVRGADLSKPMTKETIAAVRAAWLEHQVLAFPDQELTDDQLAAYTLNFGPFGEDPFIAPVPGHPHIIAVKRMADETSPVFAESWHSDWSFQAKPPQGTCLYGKTIPPAGGDTLFTNQYLALERMPGDLRRRIEGKRAVHSARNAYAPTGFYGAGDRGRSMDIRPSDDAQAVQAHPFIHKHPETGRECLFGTAGYIIGIEGMDAAEGWDLVSEIYRWQTRPQFQYRHKWSPGMLVMWDNRCTLHMATGGYAGHDRLLHRTTIGAA